MRLDTEYLRTQRVARVIGFAIAVAMIAAAVATVVGWLTYQKAFIAIDGRNERSVLFGQDVRLLPVALCIASLAQLARPTFSRRWIIGLSVGAAVVAFPSAWSALVLVAFWVLLRRSGYAYNFYAVVLVLMATPWWGEAGSVDESLPVRAIRALGFALIALLLARSNPVAHDLTTPEHQMPATADA